MRTSILAAVIAASFAAHAMAAEASTSPSSHPNAKPVAVAQHAASTNPVPSAQERADAAAGTKAVSAEKHSVKSSHKHHAKKAKAKAG